MLALIVTSMLVGAPHHTDDCRYSADRTADISSAGIASFHLDAGAGSLKVVGRRDISIIQVHGHACASSREVLDALQLRAQRSGGEYDVRTLSPDDRGIESYDYGRIDLVVEIPSSIDATIEDGSGDTYISGLRSLRATDGSGDLEITDIEGDVSVDDGSGDLTITNVRGNVDIHDGSGEIHVRDVRRNVTMSDGSGSIVVAHVGGDFTVTKDGSGDIEQSDVEGAVRVPTRSRRHRAR